MNAAISLNPASVMPMPATEIKYRADIDGMRALAVLSVVGFHAFPNWVRGGYVGVDIFFVISGFLITEIIIGALRTGSFSYIDFYARRIRRIFPALILVLLFSLLGGGALLLARDYSQLGKHIAAGAGFASNIVLWRESGYFSAEADGVPLLHLWSLAVEEQFYIVWPLLLALVHKIQRRYLPVMALVALLSFACNIYMLNRNAAAAFYLPASRLWELILGALLACREKRTCGSDQRSGWLSAAGFIVLLAAVLLLDKDTAFPGGWALLPTIGAVLLLLGGQTAWLNRTVLRSRLLVSVGLISYPLYLWHWPLLVFANVANDYEPPQALVRLGIVALSIVLAWMTYVLVETPIRKKSAMSPRGLAVALAMLLGLGLWLAQSEGMEWRPVNRDERRVFLDEYRNLLKLSFSSYYHDECNYYDLATGNNRGRIDPKCVRTDHERTFLLWGDSHAQALSYGLRLALPPSIGLAQITTSGCKPELITRPNNGANVEACRDSNAHALKVIAASRPQAVILAQSSRHERTDWESMADFMHRNGVENVIVVGPMPQWRPSLPVVAAKHYLDGDYGEIQDGLDPAVFRTNNILKREYGRSEHLQYISLIDGLCDDNGCRTTVPSRNGYKLVVSDYGHLTPAGSEFVARSIIAARLPRR